MQIKTKIFLGSLVATVHVGRAALQPLDVSEVQGHRNVDWLVHYMDQLCE